jgi:hypothetical protein
LLSGYEGVVKFMESWVVFGRGSILIYYAKIVDIARSDFMTATSTRKFVLIKRLFKNYYSTHVSSLANISFTSLNKKWL